MIFSAAMVRALLAGTKTMTRRRRPAVRYKAGDLLWVREALYCPSGGGWWYRADDAPVALVATLPEVPAMLAWVQRDARSCSPIHMPRWASRLTLLVTGVKLEWLHEISEEDAAAEGMPAPYLGDGDPPFQRVTVTRRMQFRNLWDVLHGPGAWDANPWVAAISFVVVKEDKP
jgi:hypothetical protein